MVAECVGLDLGQTAIKAVRFRRRLSGRESVEYFHLPLPYGKPVQAEPARLAGHLRNFFVATRLVRQRRYRDGATLPGSLHSYPLVSVP